MKILLIIVCLIALLVLIARYFGNVRYVKSVLLAVDILGSALFNGIPGETISGRVGTAQKQGTLRGRLLAPIINFIMGSKTHCLDAIAGDIARAKSVIADESR